MAAVNYKFYWSCPVCSNRVERMIRTRINLLCGPCGNAIRDAPAYTGPQRRRRGPRGPRRTGERGLNNRIYHRRLAQWAINETGRPPQLLWNTYDYPVNRYFN